ncbi:unnamed protein product [Victoria cruziana]
MASISFCAALGSSRICLVPFKLNHVGRATRKPSTRRSIMTRAEVKFVDSKEAEELVRIGGYVIVDVRDRTQYERAHIKSCEHVPLFVENTDNDFGTFESVGSTELQNAGKAGLVTIQGKISAVLGTVLICAYLFITLFPEQADKLLQLGAGS